MYTYTCIYMYMNIHIHLCTYVKRYRYIYIYTHTFIHTYIYIYTHTYIYISRAEARALTGKPYPEVRRLGWDSPSPPPGRSRPPGQSGAGLKRWRPPCPMGPGTDTVHTVEGRSYDALVWAPSLHRYSIVWYFLVWHSMV